MIQIHELNKSFAELRALTDCTFSLEKGELCGLVGPNGAGKSTLFKLIMGLLEPDSGSILMLNQEIIFGDTEYKKNIGYAPEAPQLYDYLTGVEFLSFIASAKQIPVKAAAAELDHWLEFFSLQDKAHELIKNYSQGMRRKLSLCSALLGQPAVLLLDEATNGLDPESSFRFKEYLRSYCQAGGCVLFSSHIIETVEHLCDRLILLAHGKIIKLLEKNQWLNLRSEDSSLEQLFLQLVQQEQSLALNSTSAPDSQ